MHLPRLLVALLVLALAGCHTATPRFREYPASAAALDEKTREKIKRGIVEPGYTPEMVFLALGKPSEPANAVDATRDGTWIYRNFARNERDFVPAGWRRRVVFDPARKGEVIVNERVDPKEFPHLEPHSVQIRFKDGHVVEVARVPDV
jgi:hypothetical protein